MNNEQQKQITSISEDCVNSFSFNSRLDIQVIRRYIPSFFNWIGRTTTIANQQDTALAAQ